jgi:CheY-like chemotaxis protein
MPRMSGLEFLREVREDSSLSNSMVFVLTTSAAESDKVSAYDKNVAGYIVKSDAEQTFVNVLGMLEHYCKVVELPC